MLLLSPFDSLATFFPSFRSASPPPPPPLPPSLASFSSIYTDQQTSALDACLSFYPTNTLTTSQEIFKSLAKRRKNKGEMGRPPCCDKEGVKKGPWTPEEDILLVSYIQENGPGNWRAVPTNTGTLINFFLFFSFLGFCLSLVK